MWNCALKFSKQRGECSKLIFQILVYYYYYKLFYTGISWVLITNHFQEANNEFRKQVMVQMHPIIPLVEKQANGFDLNQN